MTKRPGLVLITNFRGSHTTSIPVNIPGLLCCVDTPNPEEATLPPPPPLKLPPPPPKAVDVLEPNVVLPWVPNNEAEIKTVCIVIESNLFFSDVKNHIGKTMGVV